jgi:hypothetical protein
MAPKCSRGLLTDNLPKRIKDVQPLRDGDHLPQSQDDPLAGIEKVRRLHISYLLAELGRVWPFPSSSLQLQKCMYPHSELNVRDEADGMWSFLHEYLQILSPVTLLL